MNTVGIKCLSMLTVQNELENITILFVNFKKTKVKSEEKPLKLLTLSDQRGIILIMIILKVF